MVIISLLDLPLELPPDSPARRHGLSKFTSSLPEYLSRCKNCCHHSFVPLMTITHEKAKRLKVVFLKSQEMKLMVHMPTVFWHVCQYWANQKI